MEFIRVVARMVTRKIQDHGLRAQCAAIYFDPLWSPLNLKWGVQQWFMPKRRVVFHACDPPHGVLVTATADQRELRSGRAEVRMAGQRKNTLGTPWRQVDWTSASCWDLRAVQAARPRRQSCNWQRRMAAFAERS